MSRKKRQILESSLQTEQSKLIYDEFVPLNNLWKDYISDFLGNSNSEQTAPGRLVKADFHGASVIGKYHNQDEFYFIIKLIFYIF